MTCINCGKEINEDICPFCGEVIKKTINKKNYNKISNNIIYVFVACVILIILFSLIINKIIYNKNLKNQNAFINKYCNKNYIKDISISNVIDNYSCEKYASYMYDTKGTELSSNQIEKLILNNDINIFKIYYDITGEDISTIYKENIYQNSYYDFLYQFNHTDFVKKDTYLTLITNSIDNNDFNLYKSILNCYFSKYNDFEKPENYFGSTRIRANDGYIDKIRDNSQKIDFVLEYKKHIDYYPIAFLFNEELFKNAKDDKEFKGLVLENISILSYNDIENYNNWGGKFYDGTYDPILYYVLYLSKNDTDAYKKIKYITDLSKNEGYDVTYSDSLDKFLGLYNNKNDKVYYDTYNALKIEGFKCYRNCYYERNFR